MPIGPKTRRYLENKRDPSGSVDAFMRGMEGMATEIAKDTIDAVTEKHRESLEKMLDATLKAAVAKLPARIAGIEDELRSALKTKLATMPHLKGDEGYTPVKGEDYFDGRDGVTPTPDVDYLSKIATRKLVADWAATAYERMKKEGLTKAQVMRVVSIALKEMLMPEKMARALETLKGSSRLDYNALKNLPGTPVTDGTRHTLHRGGGGKQTYYYDLSDLCDGVTKSFTIPTNTRVVAVSGTDVPGGVYRPLVDWTGSGSSTLVLTSAVAAPTVGATLYILYVV